MEEPGDGKKDLDVCSEEFDALKALTDSVDIPLPVPEAPAYDNLSQFISVIRSRGQPKQPQDEAGPSSGPSTSGRGPPESFKRRFLPHQEPVMGRGRSRPLHNVLTRMEEVTQGPMAVLRNCMVNKTRVKVWIRGPSWIRGYCTGYIAAFDKQWNLALTDVDETFTRMRNRKTPIYGSVDHITCRLETMTTGSQNTGQAIKSGPSEDDDDDDAAEAQEDPRPPGEEEERDADDDEEEKEVSAGAIARQTCQTETDRSAAAAVCCSSRDAKMRADRGRFGGTSRTPAGSVAFRAPGKNRFDAPVKSQPMSSGKRPQQPQSADSLSGPLVIRKARAGSQICQRHVHQLFIRGEQIAMVAVLPV